MMVEMDCHIVVVDSDLREFRMLLRSASAISIEHTSERGTYSLEARSSCRVSRVLVGMVDQRESAV